MTSKILKKNPSALTRRKAPIPVPTQSRKGSPIRSSTSPAGGRWTFLTNHSHVLIMLSCNPSMVLRKVAAVVGITERAVQRIIADLEEEGYIERQKVGRQNHYRILGNMPLRHPIESHRTAGDLIRSIVEAAAS